MSLSIGIVGLPNVGKSTTFNALTKEQNALAENYPFATINPNQAVVPVPDPRLSTLAEMENSAKVVPATIEFVDVAGLVKGASQGEGLGNQFLGNIRDVDAILHVVRCFDDPNVVHVNGAPDPADDIETINIELAIADLQQLERKLEKLERQVKGDPSLKKIYEKAKKLQDHLNASKPLWAYAGKDDAPFRELSQEMRFLTAKPVIYAANVGEEDLTDENDYVKAVRQLAVKQGAQVIVLSAQLEEQMAGLDEDERQEYLELAGAAQGGLETIIQEGYKLLGLESFFTAGEKEARAWTIHTGWTAPQAAGVIHTDFEKGFIKAEVVPYDTFVEVGGWSGARAAGKLQIEGRDYVVKDGDVIVFRFNV